MLCRGFSVGFVTTAESQLAVRGQAVTRRSTPKVTLFEPTLFRNFVAKFCLLRVMARVLLSVSGGTKRIRTLLCAPQLFRRVTLARMTQIMWLTNLAPEIQEGDTVSAARRVGSGQSERDRCTADRWGDGLECAAGAWEVRPIKSPLLALVQFYGGGHLPDEIRITRKPMT